MTSAARARRWAAATLLALPTVVAGLIEGSARAATPACELEIAGTWQSADAEEPRLLSFTAEGWANVLGRSPDRRTEDFDILAQVRYEMDDPRRPRRLTFVARRGNDLFAAGESSWELTAYDDQSFTAGTENAQSLWTRVQTHRYFLTFAHRPAEPAERGASLVAWTSLDGRRTVVEAFGVRSARDGREPRFGPIEPDVVEQLTAQRRESDLVLRIEINAAEYRRSHRMLEAWAALDSTGVLAHDDPYGQTLDFLQTVIESVNRCRQTSLLGREHMTRMDDERIAAPERLRDAMRSLRKQNSAADVGNAVFPAKWAPPALGP
jgi:hypothetical protein